MRSPRSSMLLVLAAALAAGATPAEAERGRRARGGARAAIDIGSSGIKLLVVDRRGRTLADEKIGASLGKEIGPDRLLPRANQERAREALGLLAARARKLGVAPDEIEVIATAAVRNADGGGSAARRRGKLTGPEFLERVVRAPSGVGLTRARILSGREEAELGYRGAIRGLADARGRLVVIDTGGGSHQVIAGTGDRIDQAGSTQVGSNYVAEKILIDARGRSLEVATAADLAAADRRIARVVPALPIEAARARGATVVSTGGIAKLLQVHFRKDRVTRAEIDALRRRIAAVPAARRGKLLRRDAHGRKLSGREKKQLGLHADGARGSDGRKLPAKLTLLLHLMALAGADELVLSRTDARHVLVE